jgi:hypothetical protein
MTTADTVLGWKRRQPFAAFRIVLNSGDVIEVSTPEVLMVTEDGLAVGVKLDRNGVPRNVRLVSYPQIEAIEESIRAAPAGGEAA